MSNLNNNKSLFVGLFLMVFPTASQKKPVSPVPPAPSSPAAPTMQYFSLQDYSIQANKSGLLLI
ncbi:MAG: hypothetical protein EKK39_11300 [Sphingobacteriales bacterium]|uniref:hypothetical protein n=1 Tax=Hydrotalea flava TaxID=714549 RepID=UPI0008378617|nr:hypothetical protein [Hydrotalea flava]RTL49319.1 MAG: hypothetical protein EKK39_11300 [Sphingobacteriales bacterium]